MNDNNDADRGLEQHGYDADGAMPGAVPQPALALDEDERLPWLESADDDDDEDGGIDTPRLLRVAGLAVGLLAVILGGIWFLNHRGPGAEQVAPGGVVAAPAEPYKTRPADQGGKTFAGTGDSAFAVSEGKATPAKLGGAEVPVATPAASPSATASASPAAATPAAGGIGVQVGAYSSLAAAEAGWSRLSASHEALKGLKHRVVEGTADIGTVYRLQAVAADGAAATALCANLKAAGVACQVKR